jgi:hypothetical protein
MHSPVNKKTSLQQRCALPEPLPDWQLADYLRPDALDRLHELQGLECKPTDKSTLSIDTKMMCVKRAVIILAEAACMYVHGEWKPYHNLEQLHRSATRTESLELTDPEKQRWFKFCRVVQAHARLQPKELVETYVAVEQWRPGSGPSVLYAEVTFADLLDWCDEALTQNRPVGKCPEDIAAARKLLQLVALVSEEQPCTCTVEAASAKIDQLAEEAWKTRYAG